jgi:mRNA-degrading endonuclease RelE of RelBE toxin-antitoxin system
LKRIIFADEAKGDIRAIPQRIAMNILTAIHRLAEHGSGDVKEIKGKPGEKRLRVGDYRVRYTEEHPDAIRIHTVRNRKDAYR